MSLSTKPAHTENKSLWNCQLTWELVTEERDISQTHSFICPINHFNGLSAITIIPRAGRAGVPTISRIEKPWMAIIINAHNKNMPGSRTPRAPLHPLVYGPAAPAPARPRGGQEQRGEHQRKAVQNHHLSTDLFYCVVKDCTSNQVQGVSNSVFYLQHPNPGAAEAQRADSPLKLKSSSNSGFCLH